MRRNVATANLTKDYIESKISQVSIMAKYTGIDSNTINNCIRTGHLIKSIFRDDDTNGSMGFAFNNKGRLKIRDFGGAGFFEDIYGTVAYVLSLIYDRKIESNNKQDFYFILKHIANSFSDVIDNKAVDENLDPIIQNAIKKGQGRKTIIEIVPRSWNKQDKEYWKSLGVELSYLNTHFVIPVDQYYINRGVNSDPKYTYKVKDPCYAYILGENRNGICLIKLYFPKRNRANELKFVTNCNVLEGLLNLERNDYDYIIITKSSKDRLSLGNYLSTTPFYGGSDSPLNIGVINLPSENYKLKDNEHEWLTSKLKDGGRIISFLDFDYTGRCGAKYLKTIYHIPYIFITHGEFGLPNYKCKDFSDLHLLYSKDEIINFIKETVQYVIGQQFKENLYESLFE